MRRVRFVWSWTFQWLSIESLFEIETTCDKWCRSRVQHSHFDVFLNAAKPRYVMYIYIELRHCGEYHIAYMKPVCCLCKNVYCGCLSRMRCVFFCGLINDNKLFLNFARLIIRKTLQVNIQLNNYPFLPNNNVIFIRIWSIIVIGNLCFF